MTRMSGQCLCGRIKYSSNAEPVRMIACHCKDCQRQTGSAFLTLVGVPSESLQVTGEPKTYMQPGATSGLPMHRLFCPDCGSQLMLRREGTGRTMILAGTLDDTSVFKPTAMLFCDSRQSWVPLPPDIPAYPRYDG